MDTSVPVVVLGFHHGSLAIARTLGRLGVTVFGVHSDLRTDALATRYCRSSYRWDFANQSPEASVDYLLQIGAGIGARALLIPTSDDLAELVADHTASLAERFIFPRQDPQLVRALSDKRELYHLARRVGVPTPETLFPRDRSELVEFSRAATFPLMLKAADGLRLERRTGRKMVIVDSPDALLRTYDVLEDPSAPNLMLQEYIPGGDDTIWMFDGYFNRESELLFGATGRKLRQYPVHTGATSLGILEANETVLRMTVDFMRAVGYQGILDIGYRYDRRDGSYKLLDPNPRIGSTFRLFVGANGMDVARALYLDMTGQSVPQSPVRYGRKWVIEDQDLLACRDYRTEGSLPFWSWIRSYAGVRETAWFAADDVRPFLHMCRSLAVRAWAAYRKRRQTTIRILDRHAREEDAEVVTR